MWGAQVAQAGFSKQASPITFHTTEYQDVDDLIKAASGLGAQVVGVPEQRVVLVFVKITTGGRLYVSLADSTLTQAVIDAMRELGYELDTASIGVYFQANAP